jgi:hypothetical protein
MFSIFDVIGNENDSPDYSLDDIGYKKLQVQQQQQSHRPVNRELTGGWTAETSRTEVETKTDENFSIFQALEYC